jgi:general secretion pathway protein D
MGKTGRGFEKYQIHGSVQIYHGEKKQLMAPQISSHHCPFKGIILSLCLVIGTVCFLLSPQEAPAARIAGEDQTVTTAAPPVKPAAPQEKAAPAESPVKQTVEKPAPAAADRKKVKVIGNRDSKFYHLPGMTYYDKVEAYHRVEFDSEEAAIRAGYRKAPNGRNMKQKKPEAATPPQSAPLPAATAPVEPAASPVPSKAAALPPSLPSAEKPSPVEQPVQPASKPAPAAKGTRYVTIDFDNVDIQVFIKFISELTGKNFIFDDKVKGKVTVISPKKIAVDEVYKVFTSVLDIYGFTTAPSGDVTKIIPSQLAREKSMETRLPQDDITSEDKMVTQIISLEHANPDEMKRVLDPLISKSSVILSYPPTGMLVIADLLSNIKRLREIIDALDVEGVGETISYIPLKHASAAETLKSLNSVFLRQKGMLAPIKIVADERTNAIIISATENDTLQVKGLINLMDKEIPKGTGMIRVYYLQNAKAEDTAKVLTTLPQQAKMPDGKPAALSKAVQIVADKATNSLIITADTADYQIIEDVIKKLDITRHMVYLEALIMEVNANKNFKLGVEWMAAGKISDYYSAIGGGSGEGGKFPITSGLLTPSSTSSTASLPSLASGLTLGVIGQAIKVATVGGTEITFPTLAAFIQAYQSDTDVRILSTPQLLTLDNEEAEMTVGKNVPYVTRQDTTTTSTINYSNYEYKDVGITLKVTPQINKEGFVRLKIDQSVTKLDAQTQDVGTGVKILAPTTLKRTAKTTVTVRSGDTVVIGGLIEDYTSDAVYKIPLLGDIPLLGWLFKFKSKVGDKTNLFIFITPRIIQKPEDAVNIHQDKKDYMESLQEGTIKTTPPKKKK